MTFVLYENIKTGKAEFFAFNPCVFHTYSNALIDNFVS